jgi:hypothetical protein
MVATNLASRDSVIWNLHRIGIVGPSRPFSSAVKCSQPQALNIESMRVDVDRGLGVGRWYYVRASTAAGAKSSRGFATPRNWWIPKDLNGPP